MNYGLSQQAVATQATGMSVDMCDKQFTGLATAMPSSVTWAHQSSDPCRLKCLLASPSNMVDVKLYRPASVSSTCPDVVIAAEQRFSSLRFSLFSNLKASDNKLYHQAFQALAFQKFSDVSFSAVPHNAVAVADMVFTQHQYRQAYASLCYQYSLKPDTRDMVVQTLEQHLHMLHEQYELGPLEVKDAPAVNDLWAYKRPTGSVQYIESLIATAQTSCIRVKATGQPVSWALQQSDGSMGMLHTVQEHRRKGLGKVSMMALVRKLQSLNTQVFCYVVQENTASMKLLESIGFQNTGMFDWVGYVAQHKL